jgi:hypothetical protein
VADVNARPDSNPTDPPAKLRRMFALATSAEFEAGLAQRDRSRRDRLLGEPCC